MSENQIKPLTRKSDLVTQNVGKEILVYDLTVNKAFSFNESSSLIWKMCDGEKTVPEIARYVTRNGGALVGEDFVWLALAQMKQNNLLENTSAIVSPYRELSRREMIRRVGLNSLLSLPIISSLIVPAAVHAQSAAACTVSTGRALGCVCTAISQCQPPASRCCTSVPGNPRACAPSGLTATGSACGVNCDCVGNCCVSGLCAVDTVASGFACSATCQCIGSSTCAGGFCT